MQCPCTNGEILPASSCRIRDETCLGKKSHFESHFPYSNGIDNISCTFYNTFITTVIFIDCERLSSKEVPVLKALPQISEAEYEVMKIVWKYAPISTNEITDRLVKTTSWSPKTIQTLIKRLVTKGALTYEKQSRVFVYTPLVDKDEYIGQESSSFLNRFYDGDISAMLSAFIDHDRLSDSEISTLRSLLSSNARTKDSKKGGT